MQGFLKKTHKQPLLQTPALQDLSNNSGIVYHLVRSAIWDRDLEKQSRADHASDVPQGGRMKKPTHLYQTQI